MTQRILSVILCLATICVHAAGAQVFLQKAVISTGGGTVANSTTVLRFTTGQTVAGTASNASMSGQFGFWNSTSAAQGAALDRTGDMLSLQVYPNPAATTAKATINLATATQTSVELYDIKGNVMATLLTGMHGPGAIEIPIDLGRYPSGKYFVAVRTPGAMVQQAVTVVR